MRSGYSRHFMQIFVWKRKEGWRLNTCLATKRWNEMSVYSECRRSRYICTVTADQTKMKEALLPLPDEKKLTLEHLCMNSIKDISWILKLLVLRCTWRYQRTLKITEQWKFDVHVMIFCKSYNRLWKIIKILVRLCNNLYNVGNALYADAMHTVLVQLMHAWEGRVLMVAYLPVWLP